MLCETVLFVAHVQLRQQEKLPKHMTTEALQSKLNVVLGLGVENNEALTGPVDFNTVRERVLNSMAGSEPTFDGSAAAPSLSELRLSTPKKRQAEGAAGGDEPPPDDDTSASEKGQSNKQGSQKIQLV